MRPTHAVLVGRKNKNRSIKTLQEIKLNTQEASTTSLYHYPLHTVLYRTKY